MKPDKIYIDNSVLIRWFLHKLFPKKHKTIPQIIRFLTEHKEIKKFISILSVAELVHTLKYGKDFQSFRLKLNYILDSLVELQKAMDMEVITKENIREMEINGIIISENVVGFVDRHQHLLDCIHADLAKSHDLFFITHEKDMGVLKEFHEKIMTDDKLMKQYA
jgi:predicted nucleic-acid-binding protein